MKEAFRIGSQVGLLAWTLLFCFPTFAQGQTGDSGRRQLRVALYPYVPQEAALLLKVLQDYTLTFHKITPGEGAGARFEQLDLHSGSMLTCPVDVSGARPGQLWCDATYRVPRRAI